MNFNVKLNKLLFENTKNYITYEGIVEILQEKLPFIKIEELRNTNKKWGSDQIIPFDYGELIDYINPADNMGWDILISPDADKNDTSLRIAGVVKVSDQANKIPPPLGNKPGNHKLILGINGRMSNKSMTIIKDYFKSTTRGVFEPPQFFNHNITNPYEILEEKTLYHGTLIDNKNTIEKEGLNPIIGNFVSSSYGTSYDFDEDNYSYTNLDSAEYWGVTFAADKDSLKSAIYAMKHNIGRKLNKNPHDVTLNDIRNHGLLVVIDSEEYSDWVQHPKNPDETYYYEYDPPPSVEPGDYWTRDGGIPKYFLTGSKLIKFIEKHKSKLNENWEKSTFKKYKLDHVNDGRFAGIAVGPTTKKYVKAMAENNDKTHYKLFHISPTKYEKSILNKGLEPRIGDSSKEAGETEPKVYFYGNINDVNDGLNKWMSDKDENLTIFEITIPKDFDIYKSYDEYQKDWEWISFKHIPKNYINVYKRISSKKELNEDFNKNINVPDNTKELISWIKETKSRLKEKEPGYGLNKIPSLNKDIASNNIDKIIKKLKAINKNGVFKLDTTDIPNFDKHINHNNIVYMTPKRYLEKTAIGFGRSISEYLKDFNSELTAKYANDMYDGNKFPLVVLDYSNNNFSQEGRHRSYAAYILGLNKIPVLIIKDKKYIENEKFNHNMLLNKILLEDEDKMEFRIFCDMDGVLTDFSKQFKTLTGENITPKEYEDKYKKNAFFTVIEDEGESLWSEMEWMSDGKQLWNFIKQFNPTILSAPSRDPKSKTGKQKWLINNIPDLSNHDVQTKCRKGWDGKSKIILNSMKYRYATGPNDILIDDTPEKINKWIEAGGTGILHTDTLRTILKLKEIMDI